MDFYLFCFKGKYMPNFLFFCSLKIIQIMKKTAIFLIFIHLILSSLSCSSQKAMHQDNSNSVYLALGDSYTIGESVAENERFPNILLNALQQKGNKTLKSTQIIATTGWRTDQLEAAINSSGNNEHIYPFVSLLIGVNNQYQNRSLATYKFDFESLLNHAIQLAGGKKENVLVVSIPDYAYTPFGQESGKAQTITLQLREFNAANRQITESKGIKYANITPISEQGLEDPTLVASDGLHPSGKQYRRWVEEAILQVLEQK